MRVRAEVYRRFELAPSKIMRWSVPDVPVESYMDHVRLENRPQGRHDWGVIMGETRAPTETHRLVHPDDAVIMTERET